jgi:hypothetical protein
MKNIAYKPGYQLAVIVSDPAVPVSGDPVRFGQLTGIAMNDEGAGGVLATQTIVDFGPFVATIPVEDELALGGGIAVGDALFYDDTGSNVNNDNVNGYFFGMALAIVGNGLTATIAVLHTPSPGAGAFADLGIASGKIANGAITNAKMAALAVYDANLIAPDGLTLNVLRTAKFEWDFATDAHAVGTVAFRGATLPAKARIVEGHCYVKTALTGGAGATAAIQVTGANDIISATVVAGVPWSTSDAMVPIVPVNTTATAVKSEAAGGKPSLVIGTNDLTAGNIQLWLNYVVHT